MITETIQTVVQTLAPPPILTISQHADQNRYISADSGSSEPGKYHVSRTEYMREIMDSVCDPDVEQVVIMSSARVGKSTLLENVINYYIDCDPTSILVVLPTLSKAEEFSKKNLTPLIRDHQRLQDRFKRSGLESTILNKYYQGGSLDIVGSNSPSGLSALTKRIVLLDEVDRFDASAGDEGDPVRLAIKRAATFWNRKIVLTSTPALKESSRIETAYNQSDQRHYHIPCPSCGEFFNPTWSMIKWDKDKSDIHKHYPETARIECPHCSHHIYDVERHAAVRRGKWIAENPESTIRGYHIWAYATPWYTLAEIVREFLEVKKDSEQLKVFINTVLGESYEEKGEQIEPNNLWVRRESYTNVPDQVACLTAAVDTQDDRFEIVVLGWSHGFESYLIDRYSLYCDTSAKDSYDRLDQALQRRYDGLDIVSAFIDSGGHRTQSVYEYVKDKAHRRIYAIKGRSEPGQPLVSRPSRSNLGNVQLITIGVDNGKSWWASKLKLTEAGAGYPHFNMLADEEFFNQLCSEKLVTRHKNGVPYTAWQLIRRGQHNEILDLYVYNLACVTFLNPNFDALLQNRNIQVSMPSATEQKEKTQQRKSQSTFKVGGGFSVTNFNKY